MLNQLVAGSNLTSLFGTLSKSSFISIIIVYLIIVIIGLAGMWKTFEKAGRKGWYSIIPFYNLWVLFEISGFPGWWMFSVFLTAIPFVGALIFIAIDVYVMLNLAKLFGKSTGFAIFGLVIFGLIGFLILGFGDSQYQGTNQQSIQ